jgi:hypothetical protein
LHTRATSNRILRQELAAICFKAAEIGRVLDRVAPDNLTEHAVLLIEQRKVDVLELVKNWR